MNACVRFNFGVRSVRTYQGRRRSTNSPSLTFSQGFERADAVAAAADGVNEEEETEEEREEARSLAILSAASSGDNNNDVSSFIPSLFLLSLSTG